MSNVKFINFEAPYVKTPTDQDFYKFTMKAAVFHCYPEVVTEHKFVCRTPGADLRFMYDDLVAEVNRCAQMYYFIEEVEYVTSPSYFNDGYRRFLNTQTWKAKDVTIKKLDTTVGGGLDIRIKGPWLYNIDWEIWLLKMISALWAKRQMGDKQSFFFEEGHNRLLDKLELLKKNAPDLRFMDMAARRTCCTEWHEHVLRTVMEVHPSCLAGTSNVSLSKKLGIPFFGTHAHEWDSAHLAFYNPLEAKRMAMQHWMEVFGGDCGTCLTDTLTTDVFLKSFNKMFANAYTGVRHDSGPWDIWAKKMLDHYKKLGIDPKTKTLVFSDSLDFPKMIEIYHALKDYCKVCFGIGTNLGNDLGFTALSIVIKMIKCNGLPVLKLSDDLAKMIHENPTYMAYVMDTLGIK